jgi:transposase-like protein
MADREQLIDNAVAQVRRGRIQKVVAKQFGVCPSTLSRRRRGHTSHKKAAVGQQRLSPVQENFLVEWSLHEESAGRAPRVQDLRRVAAMLLRECGDSQPLGKRWHHGYVQRNPGIRLKGSTAIDTDRAWATSEGTMRQWWKEYEELVEFLGVRPSEICNMDEHGMQEGDSSSGKVLGTSLTSRATVMQSSATEWVSIIECVDLAGRRYKPAVVFKGENVQGQWFPPTWFEQRDLPGWKYTATATGWSNNEVGLDWLRECFILHNRPSDRSRWRLLLLDGHSSHVSPEFQFESFRNKVWLRYLLPHTSHITQPLDVGVFSSLKQRYRDMARQLVYHFASAPVNKQRFLLTYRQASELAITLSNITSGFRKAGLWPVNVNKPLTAESRIEPRLASLTEAGQGQAGHVQATRAIRTPKKGQDLLEMHRRELLGAVEANRHTAIRLFSKAAKAIDLQAAELAASKHRISFLEAQLEAQQPQGRKAVKRAPNSVFPYPEDIELARQQAMRQRRREAPDAVVFHAHLMAQTSEQLQHIREQYDDVD